MKLDELNPSQILTFIGSESVEDFSYLDINELLRRVTTKFYKASTKDSKTELLFLLKSIHDKRNLVIAFLTDKIISEAETKAEELFNKTKAEIEPNLDPRIRGVRKYIVALIDSITNEYKELEYWDVTSDNNLNLNVIDALKKAYIQEIYPRVEENFIIEQLTSIITEQFLRNKSIIYLQTCLDSYDESIDMSFEPIERLNFTEDFIPKIEETPFIDDSLENFEKPDDVIISSEWVLNAKAWHYAIALALVQKAGSLEHTIGNKRGTILQAKNFFKVSDKLSRNIYDSMKRMKYPDNEHDWDINYALREAYTQKRKNYKRIVISLLGRNKNAISLVDALID